MFPSQLSTLDALSKTGWIGQVAGHDPYRLSGSHTLRSFPSGITLPSMLEKDVRSATTACASDRTSERRTGCLVTRMGSYDKTLLYCKGGREGPVIMWETFILGMTARCSKSRRLDVN